ncbi:MAG TPA: Imm42 family immunity protein [Candidatus Saccharimonadia bacterium]|nr:Imm42 family immunity protein [Candidatus Saccharimonadia bacterium]
MIVGDRAHFGIESGITQAYEGPGFPALGYFCIHVTGKRHGVFAPDATMLGCSFDAVEKRLTGRGSHVAPFAAEADGGLIADSVYRAIYASDQENLTFFGMSHEDFEGMVHDREIIWAPDGDEAFDDGAYVLQFDVGERVRLIAFKSGDDYHPIPDSLAECWMDSDDYYRILREWLDGFVAEWQGLPKAPR